MRNLLRCLAVVLFLVVISAGTVLADSNLNVHLFEVCLGNECTERSYINGPGSPADGSADFNYIQQPWKIDFQTGNPTEWMCTGEGTCDGYSAMFGVGGYITIDGPDGLTFSGQITSGTAGYYLDYGESVAV